IFLMLGGRWLQQSAVERNRRRLLQSTSIPESVCKMDADNHELITRLGDVARGDLLRIKSGEVIPVTAILRSLHAIVSLEWINGESEAREQTEGQRVPSGALNIGSDVIEVECLEAWKESLLHRLSNASSGGCETVPFFAGLLRGYLAAVIITGIAGFIFWLAHGASIPQALQIMISVFIVSCPCALGVSAPLADDLAASKMERLGVFVRASGIWQKLARIRTLIFDKTGTLTMENPQLVNPESLDALSNNECKMLRHLAASNLHPVSRGLFEALGSTLEADESPVDEVAGLGVRCIDSNGRTWKLARPDSQSNADCIYACDGTTIAEFRFRESLRPETVGAFNVLRQKCFAIHLLSGDRTEKVAQTANTLGLPREVWHAELTPAEKAAQVRQIDPAHTLFIGDGANDSLAFEAALCSGSPVTGRNFLEHRADFYFIGNSLRFVPQLLETAKLRQRAVRRVFSFALCYNIGAVAVSLSGHMSPLLAAILMPLSSVVTLGIVRLTFGGEWKIDLAKTQHTVPNLVQLPQCG
ncbi:MAG: HAD-IC family P-type ATPase, partial [Verrucomicrobiaceae bacterium]